MKHEKTIEWTDSAYVYSETAYGWQWVTENKVPITCRLYFDDEFTYANWEWENESEGVYVSGGVWFDGLNATEYDGCFSLSPLIIDKLNELGYNTEEIE